MPKALAAVLRGEDSPGHSLSSQHPQLSPAARRALPALHHSKPTWGASIFQETLFDVGSYDIRYHTVWYHMIEIVIAQTEQNGFV